jgi:hypothetical protein
MAHYLRIVSSLPRQALHGVALGEDLGIGHDLDSLERLRYILKGVRNRRHRAVYELRPWIECVVEERLQRIELLLRVYGVRPDPCNLPNIDLTVCNYV